MKQFELSNMKLTLPILCILIGVTIAEPPPPNYMYNNYDGMGHFPEASNSQGNEFGGQGDYNQGGSSDGGYSQGSGGYGGGGGNEVEDNGEHQTDDFGFDGSPGSSFEGGQSSHSSYGPPSFDGGFYGGGPVKQGGGRKRGIGGMSLGFLPKIRIMLPRRHKVRHVSASTFSYPSYGSSSGGGHSSPQGSPVSFGSSDFSYPGSYGGSEGNSYGSSSDSQGPSSFESPTSAYGAPSKGPHSSYESPMSYEMPSKGPQSFGSGQSDQYGPPKSGGQDGGYNSPSNQYGQGPNSNKGTYGKQSSNQYGPPLNSNSGGYGKQSSNQYGPISNVGGFGKAPSSQYSPAATSQTGGYGNSLPQKQSSQYRPNSYKSGEKYAPSQEYGSGSRNNLNSGYNTPAMAPSGGYVRGKSYTKYGPPIKGHTQSSLPIPMGGFGDDVASTQGYDTAAKGYGPPSLNKYPDSGYKGSQSQQSQGGVGSSSYNDYNQYNRDNENENRYKRRPSQSYGYGESPRKAPKGKGYPVPSKPNQGAYSASQNNYDSYDNYQNYHGSNSNDESQYDAGNAGPREPLYNAEDLAGY